jgi:phosphopantetheine adenylyltransferase
VKLRELFEATEKTAVAAFGRFNPPTIGHEKLVNAIKKVPGEHFLFLSHTQNHKTDPLSFEQKLQFATKFFPGVKVGDSSVRTIIDMMKKLSADGFNKIVYVAGSDRTDSFEQMLNKYNGIEYNFNSITVINAGARDPDAEGAEGMSASKMRDFAAKDNFEEFAKGVPNIELADELFSAVKAGLTKPAKVKK